MSEARINSAQRLVVIGLAVIGGIAMLAVAGMALMHSLMMTNFVC